MGVLIQWLLPSRGNEQVEISDTSDITHALVIILDMCAILRGVYHWIPAATDYKLQHVPLSHGNERYSVKYPRFPLLNLRHMYAQSITWFQNNRWDTTVAHVRLYVCGHIEEVDSVSTHKLPRKAWKRSLKNFRIRLVITLYSVFRLRHTSLEWNLGTTPIDPTQQWRAARPVRAWMPVLYRINFVGPRRGWRMCKETRPPNLPGNAVDGDWIDACRQE